MRAGVRFIGITFLLMIWARAENWPHWRGPDGNGVSSEKNPAGRVEHDGTHHLEGPHGSLERCHAYYLG